MALTCGQIDQMFLEEGPRFGIDIHEKYNLTSVWGRLTRIGKFPFGMGTTQNEVTIARMETGEFEDDWDPVETSDLVDTNGGCIPEAKRLEWGQIVKSWDLRQRTYDTHCLCLDDLKTTWQIQEQIEKTIKQLTRLQASVMDNRKRSGFLRLVPKMSSGHGFITHEDFNTVPAPTSLLLQDTLDNVRIQVLRQGAGDDALGKINGAPVLGLIVSPEQSAFLLRGDDKRRDDLRHAEPNKLLDPLGVTMTYGGFYHLIDFEAPRFRANMERVYPHIKVNTTKGVDWIPNPAYENAPFEATYVYAPNWGEVMVQQVGPDIPDAAFDDYPQYYEGTPFWLNIKHRKHNPLGKIGNWMLAFQNGIRPLDTYLGRVIIHRRCAGEVVATCTNPPAPPALPAITNAVLDTVDNEFTLTGTGFTGATGATVDGVAVENFVVVSATSITFDDPTGTGTVEIVVNHPNGDSSTYEYTYA